MAWSLILHECDPNSSINNQYNHFEKMSPEDEIGMKECITMALHHRHHVRLFQVVKCNLHIQNGFKITV